MKEDRVYKLKVYKSNRNIFAYIIDGKNVKMSCSTLKSGDKINKTELAKKVGNELRKKAKSNKITNVKFDRGMYKYHGQVKALCEGFYQGEKNKV